MRQQSRMQARQAATAFRPMIILDWRRPGACLKGFEFVSHSGLANGALLVRRMMASQRQNPDFAQRIPGDWCFFWPFTFAAG